MTEPITPQGNNTPEKKASTSLLADIIKASAKKSETITEASTNNTPKAVAKIPREPISLGTFLRLIGSLLFVSIIFFGSFLAYIAFNPQEAMFFVNTFNIDPNDIKRILIKLINGTFGFLISIVSIAWIITLFRAFWVPKELKRKKLLSWLLAWVVGIILFCILAFWWYLFSVVNANEYDNPEGRIIIYDQDRYSIEKYRNNSRLTNTQNLIGPINIFFDLRSNANLISKRFVYDIQSFQINFDGASCNSGKAVITGSNPANEQSLVCTFDQIKPYNISGTYTVKNRAWETLTIPIALPSIEIRGLVSMKTQVNNVWDRIMTIDASSLRRLGEPRWIYENDREVMESTITETLSPEPFLIALDVFDQPWYDRIFVMQDKDAKDLAGAIQVIQDRTDSRLFQFALTGITINPNQIIDIEWLLDGKSVICREADIVCSHAFTSYGRKNVKATLQVANGDKYTYESEVTVNEPINLVRHIKVFDANGRLLNETNSFDQSLRAFVLKNTIIPPEVLTFDARDVVSGTSGFMFDNVLWRITAWESIKEERWVKVDVEFSQPLRYTIEGIITFKKSVPGEKDIEEIVKEMVIVDIERKSLMPRLDISLSSDYVPSLVTVDASQSQSDDGEVKKFIFDFWEGRPPAEGDAIQQYQYSVSWDKTITLTIISEKGERASIKKTIVLKDQIKTIDWKPSVASGVPGSHIDFEAVTPGQIEDYIWNFWDNTPVEHGLQVTHSFANTGTYTITLTIIYADGTQRSAKKTYEVKAE
jgi:hypothetical protein